MSRTLFDINCKIIILFEPKTKETRANTYVTPSKTKQANKKPWSFIKSFCTAKETINQKKRKSSALENICEWYD